jgi:hypothetical protein
MKGECGKPTVHDKVNQRDGDEIGYQQEFYKIA